MKFGTKMTPGWEDQPDDPDLEEHLGYELCDWERIRVDNSEEVVFLPEDGKHLSDDAFIIVNKNSIHHLKDTR